VRLYERAASFEMANPFDRSAIEPFGADRRALGRVGRRQLRMRSIVQGTKKNLDLSLARSAVSKDAFS